MTRKKLSQLNLEDLTSREDTLRKASPWYVLSISVMVITGFILTLNRGFNVFTIIPLVFILTYISYRKNLKDLREEIIERERRGKPN